MFPQAGGLPQRAVAVEPTGLWRRRAGLEKLRLDSSLSVPGSKTMSTVAGRLPSVAALEREYGLFDTSVHPLTFHGGELRCSCSRCERWANFVRHGNAGQPFYLVPTLELVGALTAWLCQLAATMEPSQDCWRLRVLEVGAGDGSLSHHLQLALSERGAPVRLFATDSGARGLRPLAPASVACRDAASAVAEFVPDVVLCAFMPLGVDWTSAFRACVSVQAYILLGEVDDGCCGRPWPTWGFVCDDDDDLAAHSVSSTSGSEADNPEDDPEDDPEDEGDADGFGGVRRRVGDDRAAKRQRTTECIAQGEGWRRVYAYEPRRTPWGAEGWERVLSDPMTEAMDRALLGCTDVPWSSRRHARAVLFRRLDR